MSKQMTVAELKSIVDKQGKCIEELVNAYADQAKLINAITTMTNNIHDKLNEMMEVVYNNTCNCDCNCCNEEEDEFPIEAEEVLPYLCEYYHCDMKTFLERLTWLYQYAPNAFINTVINGIARLVEDAYEGDLRDLDVIYCINTLNGKITPIKKDQIKSYKYFSAFRSQEDAVMAMQAWTNIKKYIVNNCLDAKF